jgi:phage major head subunit gpT-like protein
LAGPNIKASDFAGAMKTAIKMEFADIYAKPGGEVANPAMQRLCLMAPSNGPDEEYEFGRAIPWPAQVGAEVAGGNYQTWGVDDDTYTVYNYTYGDIFKIREEVWKDDRNGYIKMKAQEIVQRYPKFVWKKFSELITAGSSTACHDGVNFFGTTHGAGAVNNADANKPLNSTTTCLANLEALWDLMTAFTDSKGNLIGCVPDTIVTRNKGTTFWNTKVILRTDREIGTGNNDDNPIYGDTALAHISTPYLADDKEYYLFDTRFHKPFIFQDRQSVEVLISEPDADNPFFRVRTDIRFGLGYGPWYTGICGDLS